MMFVKKIHTIRRSATTPASSVSVHNTIESELCHINLFQIFEGNREIEDNLLENVNNKLVVDNL